MYSVVEASALELTVLKLKVSVATTWKVPLIKARIYLQYYCSDILVVFHQF
jgi:hypothetical protein